MNHEDIEHLDWIYYRMTNIHKEKEDYDYMIKFKEILINLEVDTKPIKWRIARKDKI